MGEGVGKVQEMGLEQNKPEKENRDRPKNVGARRRWPILIAQGRAEGGAPSTLPDAQDSGVQPVSPPPPTGRVKAGRGPFSQFKQLPLITPFTGGRRRRAWREMHGGGASGTETEQELVAFGLGA